MIDLKISAIVPCYNEGEGIKPAYEEIDKVLRENYEKYEIVFIDDGSKDNTLEILETISKNNKNCMVLSLSRNFGKEAAMSAGLSNCTGDIAAFLDADLQDPPELLPEMTKKLIEENCNVIYGVRKKRPNETFLKKLTSKLFYRILNKLSDVEMPLDSADFKIIDREIINEFKRMGEKNKYVRGLISWIGYKQIPFYYDRKPRLAGKTKFSFFSLFKLAMTGVFYFTKKPLHLVTVLGIIFLFFGFILLIYILLSVFLTSIENMAGWASILTTVVVFAGVQLLTLGIIGTYVGNIFDEVKKRPEFIIKKKTPSNTKIH